MDSLQCIHTGEPSTGLRAPVLSEQGSAERKDHLPYPAGNSLPDAAQDNICLPCCQGTLLARAQLCVHQNHFWKAVFQLFGPQLLLVHAVVPPSMQDFVLPLLELHKAPVRFLDRHFTTSSQLEPSSSASFQYTPLATYSITKPPKQSFLNGNVIGDSVKSLDEVRINSIKCYAPLTEPVTSPWNAVRLVRHHFPL